MKLDLLEADGSRRDYELAPSKIVCVGVNYRAHAAEMGKEPPAEPLIFLKPPSALAASGTPIELPPGGYARIDHEAELGIVIGRRARRVTRAEAFDYVLGVTCVNDVSVRDLQKRDGQWTRAKGFDTFCPVGPCVRAGLDPRDVAIVARVNGEVRQQSRSSDMIFDVPALLEFITDVMTLEPGDLISTGTPPGVGPLAPGDTVEIEIDGVGVLANPVVARP